MSVVGLDFGNLSVLIGQAGRGGVDVILNDSSNRQTASYVSIQGKQRFLGDSGSAMVRKDNDKLCWKLAQVQGISSLLSTDPLHVLIVKPFKDIQCTWLYYMKRIDVTSHSFCQWTTNILLSMICIKHQLNGYICLLRNQARSNITNTFHCMKQFVGRRFDSPDVQYGNWLDIALPQYHCRVISSRSIALSNYFFAFFTICTILFICEYASYLTLWSN